MVGEKKRPKQETADDEESELVAVVDIVAQRIGASAFDGTMCVRLGREAETGVSDAV